MHRRRCQFWHHVYPRCETRPNWLIPAAATQSGRLSGPPRVIEGREPKNRQHFASQHRILRLNLGSDRGRRLKSANRPHKKRPLLPVCVTLGSLEYASRSPGVSQPIRWRQSTRCAYCWRVASPSGLLGSSPIMSGYGATLPGNGTADSRQASRETPFRPSFWSEAPGPRGVWGPAS
jgi:hypothetical protein